MNETKPKDVGVAAVDRALAILDAFRERDNALTLHELATRTGMYKSTILRLLFTLEQRGCIVRQPDGTHQLGAVLVRWGSLYLSSVRVETHVIPVLEALAAQTGESATYYTRRADARMCLARVDCTRSVRDHVKVGDVLPLHLGAGGKVLLAFDPANRSSPRVPRAMVIVTLRERDSEGAGMAAPVFGAGDSLLGAISLSGAAGRFGRASLPKLARPLLVAAAELTARLGGDPSALRAAVANPFRTRAPAASAAME